MMMLSAGVTEMLDQVRSEFGLNVEVLDLDLTQPDFTGGDRTSVSPELHTAGRSVAREGRPTTRVVEGQRYRFVPLRSSRSVLPTALLALRVDAVGSTETIADSWLEVLRGVIEADLSGREDSEGERQQARAVRGALRFVKYVASAVSEGELAEAAIQAAAVWFDIDARVYRRRADGGYVLAAALPGVDVPAAGRHLPAGVFDAATEARTVVAAARDRVVVPMSVSSPSTWVLVLSGAVPPDAEATIDALGRVLGVQMERLSLSRASALRGRFEPLLVRGERAVELVALDLLRELLLGTGGTGASLWVQHGGDRRRMAVVGTGISLPDGDLPGDETTSDVHHARLIALGGSRRARLEMVADSERPFDVGAAAVTDACVSVMRAWLPAAVRQGTGVSVVPSELLGFARRIDEELARAKRFERDLAVVVVEPEAMPGSPEGTDALVGLLRDELRGSDVLGLMGDQRIVVLLVETNRTGIAPVVRRLRARLGRAIPELKLPRLVLGQAAYSKECATADALLSQAVVTAEVVTVAA